jgi:hypothetical protein
MTRFERAKRLLCLGDVEAALVMFHSIKPKRSDPDVFRISEAYNIAICNLVLGRYDVASEQFKNLARESISSVSLHHIGIGFCHWYLNDTAAAVKCWRKSGACAYSNESGLDSVIVHVFAAAKRPDLFSHEVVTSLADKVRRRLYTEDYPYWVMQYMTGQMAEDEFRNRMTTCTLLNKPEFSAWLSLRIDFHVGLKALIHQDLTGYWQGMEAAARFGKYDNFSTEMLIARLELLNRDSSVTP